MKVVHIGQMIGGLQIYIKNSISAMPIGDIDYVIIRGEKDKSHPISRGNGFVREYAISMYRQLRPWNDLKGFLQIIKILKKESPDLIHCHSAKGGFLGRMAGCLLGIKTIYTPHAFSFLCSSNKFKIYLYKFLEKFARTNSYLLACSNSELKMGKEIVKYDDEHSFVWQNAVPDASKILENSDDLELPEVLKTSSYVCTVGRPSYQKNTEQLVDVIRLIHNDLPDLKFVLLGVGFYSPGLKKMKSLISKYGLDNTIILQPWLEQKETMFYIKHSLFYITLARYEGLPLSVIEAMSLGKAIVATKVPGNIDCVYNGENGFLVDINDNNQIGSSIIELVKDKNKRDSFGLKSRSLFKESFLLSNRIGELEHIYKNLCK